MVGTLSAMEADDSQEDLAMHRSELGKVCRAEGPRRTHPWSFHGRYSGPCHGSAKYHGLYHGTVHGPVVGAMEHAMVFG